jgi:hypothetical protein
MNLEEQKNRAINQGGLKMSEPNMVMETKQEVIDTIAKKDFSKESFNQQKCVGCPISMLFVIKKGDPIQVIKQTNIGTKQKDVFYLLRKHNGQNYAKLSTETPKQPVTDNSVFKGWISLNLSSLMGGAFSEYSLPSDVVEEPSILEKKTDEKGVKKSNPKYINIILIGLVGIVIYKLIKK